MLSTDLILKNPSKLEELLKIREVPNIEAKTIIQLIEKNRSLITKLQNQKAKRNQNTKNIETQLQKSKSVNQECKQTKELIAKQKLLNNEIQQTEQDYNQTKEELQTILYLLPNWLEADLPIGGEDKNQIVKHWGEIRKFDFPPHPHYEIAERKGYLDPVRGAKIAGSRFVVYYSKMARLERKLMNFMIDLHTTKFGYIEVNIPLLVSERAMMITGQYPRFRGEYYSLPDDNLHLIPTSEVALVNLHADEIFEEKDLPRALVAFSSCFRREAGTAGKNTRGLVRLHQFQKVELVHFCLPEDSQKIHMYMLDHAEEVLRQLEIPFRTVLKASSDTGASACKSYDLEVWLPGMNCWLEISSVSNCRDYQSRRGMIRYRPSKGSSQKKTQYVHTLNGSGLALGRTMIAIIENYQTKDGDFEIPKVLTSS